MRRVRIVRHARAGRDTQEVGPARLSALSVLAGEGPKSLGELARSEEVRPATMSRIVRALLERGLLKRAVDPSDGRRVVLTVTPKGERVLGRLEAPRERELTGIVARLTPADKAHLARTLDALDAALTGQLGADQTLAKTRGARTKKT